MADLVSIAVAILLLLILAALTIGRFFRQKIVRKRIMVGAVVAWLVAATVYFGFIALVHGGDLNR